MTNFDPERRELLKLGVVTGSALVVADVWPPAPADAAQATSAAPSQSTAAAPVPIDVLLRVNGPEHRLTLDPRTTLLDALREHLHLTGSKKGCGLGQCGA